MPSHPCHGKAPPKIRSVRTVHLGARQHAHAFEAQDHQAVADGDDEHGHDEGEDEDADLQQDVPVPRRLREDQLAVHDARGCAGGRGGTWAEMPHRKVITSYFEIKKVVFLG